MKHTVTHGLDRDDAKRLLDETHADYARRFAKYHPRLTWSGPDQARVSFHAMGRDVEAGLRLLDHAVEIDIDVPFVFRPFVGAAKHGIEREVARLVTAFRARGPSAPG